MAELEFRAAMGIVAIVLATCSIFANFVLIDMCCTRIEQKEARMKIQDWELEKRDEIEQIQARMELNRRKTILRWMQDVRKEKHR